jgi:hypothetical protein
VIALPAREEGPGDDGTSRGANIEPAASARQYWASAKGTDMTDSSNPIRHDAVRLVAAVIARGPDSELAHDIAEEAVHMNPPADFAVDVADIAASTLQVLAEAEGETKETVLQEISDRRSKSGVS